MRIFIKNKIAEFLGLPFLLDKINVQNYKINELTEVIKERTNYHLDVHSHAKHDSYVILIGKYGKRDFVKCYNIPDNSFKDLIDHCRNLEKYAERKRIDSHPELSACINNELKSMGY
jgi:hypothetical protein